MITSSLYLTPANLNATCKAEVPLTTATAIHFEKYHPSSSQIYQQIFPELETYVELMHSFKYFFSFPIKIERDRINPLDLN